MFININKCLYIKDKILKFKKNKKLLNDILPVYYKKYLLLLALTI